MAVNRYKLTGRGSQCLEYISFVNNGIDDVSAIGKYFIDEHIGRSRHNFYIVIATINANFYTLHNPTRHVHSLQRELYWKQ